MVKTILTVTLNPALDEIVHVKDSRLGFLGTAVRTFPGGKGINVTRALAALGMRSSSLVAVAGKNGRTLVRGLKRERISFKAFELSSGETRVNCTAIEDLTGRVTRTMGPAPRWNGRDQRGFCELFRRMLKGARILVLSGRLPSGLSSKYYAVLIREAQDQGIPVVLDTSGPALKAGVRARPEIVKPNREEAEAFLGHRLISRRAVRKALQSFLDCGMKRVLLTLGGSGLAVAEGGQFYFVPAQKVRPGHGVGSGDAALAGFLTGWQRGEALATCACLAAACGTANFLTDLPGGINRNAVKRIMATIKVKRL